MKENKLTTLDLSNLVTSSATNMVGMFGNCRVLQSLDLSNFDTPKLQNTAFQFFNCHLLTSINLSNFKTSNVLSMSQMFLNCTSLTSIDLSNFDTKQTFFMTAMFFGCKELKQLNLSNFITTKNFNSYGMFYGCSKLISLDISNFDFSQTSFMASMFYDCNSLQYINFKNFIECTNPNITNIFFGVPDNIVYCSANEANMPKIISELNKKSCTVNDCSADWKSNSQKKIIESRNNICVNDCKDDNEYFYEYKNKCYNPCPEGTHLLAYIDYLCIIDCPEYLPYEKDDECLDYCSGTEFFNKICRISNQTEQAKDNMINIIFNDIKNGLMDSLLNNNLNGDFSDVIIKDENEVYQITTPLNQNTNNYNELSTINLGECEIILKEVYNINSNQNLIIYKMEYKIDEFLIPIIEYKVFNPINNEVLNLTYCNKTKININIPVSIEEENLYKYNPYSEYYNNECYQNLSDCENINLLFNVYHSNNFILLNKNIIIRLIF